MMELLLTILTTVAIWGGYIPPVDFVGPELGATVLMTTRGGTATSSPQIGTILYGDANKFWVGLPPGSNAQVLTLAAGLPTWAASAGGGGGGAGNVATSTNETSTEVAYWTSTGATPATLGSDAGLTYNDGTNALTATTFVGALTGLASTATASADNPDNCSAGSYPLGVDANWDVESCTDASTEINSVVNGLGGTNLTCASENCDVDDAFLVNSADDTTSFGITMGSATTSDTFSFLGYASTTFGFLNIGLNDGNLFSAGDFMNSGAATTSGQFNVGDDTNTATSTLIIGNSNVLNGGCVVIEDYDGAGLTFLVTLNGTGTFSQTDCRINI